MHIEPYLFFEGRCEEAAAFYRDVLGAEVTLLLRYQDSPDPIPPGMIPPGAEDKVMHMSLRIGDSTVLASDGNCTGQANFQGITLSLNLPDTAEAERVFAALSDGGQVRMPLGRTFFATSFGMVTDRFGVAWMIIVLP